MMSGYPSYPAYPAGTPGAPGAPGGQLQLTGPYPVRLAIPERQRLNRAAVFFRFFLAIPGMIVSSVATEGASSLVLFVAWLIALVNGHLPRPLHQALTALLRYQIRLYCYYWMLT